ncbi:MAG: hypothetical protein ACFCU2_10700 [Acidimicrobiia bacterium]
MLIGMLAVAANILAAMFLIPQMVRLIRFRDPAGVSATWAAFGVITNLIWVLYLGSLGIWAGVPAPAMALGTYGVMLAVLVGLGGFNPWWRSSLGYIISIIAVWQFGGFPAIGLLLALSPALQILPELVEVYQQRSPSGLSPVTWVLGTCEAVLWGAFGWLVGEAAMVGYGVVTSVGSLLILGRWWATRNRTAGTFERYRVAPA